MDLNNKPIIINASNGSGWYPKGTDRLVNSLNYVGWGGEVKTWNNWPNSRVDKSNPYNVKVSAFLEVLEKGYTHILWCDCSLWAVNDPMSIFDIINEAGYFFWRSGFNCAQVCSDKSLDIMGVTRDQVESWPDVSTSCFGVNLENPEGRSFILQWIDACRDGVFNGSRHHENQSQDPRFLFHRQDQSAASLVLGKMGITPRENDGMVSYWGSQKENTVFMMRGM